jgi:hypothetical protein
LLSPEEQWCSIGILAIDYFTQLYDRITIHGFDHLVPTSDGKVEHYYPTPPKDSCYHSSEKERVFVENLISEGKITRLV